MSHVQQTQYPAPLHEQDRLREGFLRAQSGMYFDMRTSGLYDGDHLAGFAPMPYQDRLNDGTVRLFLGRWMEKFPERVYEHIDNLRSQGLVRIKENRHGIDFAGGFFDYVASVKQKVCSTIQQGLGFLVQKYSARKK